MEVQVHLDGDPATKEVGFFQSKVASLEAKIKSLEFDNAELARSNEQLSERVKFLASRQPTWPKGYRPRRYNNMQRKG